MLLERKTKSVMIIAPYPKNGAPGQRFRYEQYLSFLEQESISYTYYSFLDTNTNSILYQQGYYLKKIAGVLTGFFNRIRLLFKVPSYDFVFIFREATPVGPPVIEWVIAKVLKKKIIYDFDDAIWLPNTSEANKIAAYLKFNSKVSSICKWAYKVSCGNRYLCAYASKFNNKVVLNPTTIDTINHHNRIKNQHSDKFIIGWTGTHSTMIYLAEIVPVLEKLEEKLEFKFLIISNKEPDFKLKSLEYRQWREESEIDDLLEFNIGLMPLTHDQWSEGKCGFKALQYMALGIPALVSPVGVNKEIVSHGYDGFLCSTLEDWEKYILELCTDAIRREEMGRKAQSKIELKYSVNSNKFNFLDLFN
ncbi:hypothetical protein AHMF7616_02714 [Adhaeribacter pallidiroseus]|uniref:Glycosyl transferase family 1 domain-containing protein n=2 Tax=Adhaeribacter pallidiroseus TaxID=2072847 RepID=A0A369QH98_9BACT|nr:hypothetical protein AHMF7616_02714 [Adhaeribacter pallidiroseus]